MTIKSKPPTKEYEDGWDRIFGQPDISNLYYPWYSRIDIIGQNGNDGLHYEQVHEVQKEELYSLCTICGKELEKVSECAWTSCPKLFEGT